MKQTFPFPISAIHIIGIGGIGMSGYAEVLHNMGYTVQGSDQSENANVMRLRALGVRIMIGHDSKNILDNAGVPCAVVVKSTAVKDDNPEILAARTEKIPVIPRVTLLAELMKPKWCVNVSGTHGKTTTTSMIGHVLEKTGMDPTVINGGIINAYGTNTRMGASRWMVVESDESDGTFAHLPSVASIITNIDPEHMDHYGTFDTVKQAFVDYTHNLPFYGVVIACIDHPVVEELLPRFQRKTITYGFNGKADIQAINVVAATEGLTFDVRINDPHLSHFPPAIEGVKLPMFGRHNVQNALTAFALGHEIGLKAEKIAEALARFSGVRRRFTITGVTNGVTVVDDYAHHPVEIAAVLSAGRDATTARKGHVIAVMQPHRFTRLANLFDAFGTCFSGADEIVIADVYPAGESPIEGVNADALATAVEKAEKKTVHRIRAQKDLAPLIARLARPGDFVICLGAGNITQWAHILPQELKDISRQGDDNNQTTTGAAP